MKNKKFMYQTHRVIRLGRVTILIEKKQKVRRIPLQPYKAEDLGYVKPHMRLL